MCFLIGVTDKEALLGSVSDDPYDVRTFMKIERPKGKLAHIGTELISTTEHTLEERGYFARAGETTRGINEAGLAFTCAMVIEDPTIEKTAKAEAFADLTKWMMENCETVSDAIELFTSKKAINPAYSILLADAKGDLAHLEAGNFGTAINAHFTKEKPGSVFAVNCYLSQTLVNYNAPHTRITDQENNNRSRRSRGIQFTEEHQGKIDIELLMRLLSDHAHSERDPRTNPILDGWGFSICNHGTRKKDDYPHENLPWGTVSAEILQPSKKLFWYAYGWPCGQKPQYGDQLMQENSWGKFVPFNFEDFQPTTPLGEIKNKT